MLGICGPPLEIDAVARADAAGALYDEASAALQVIDRDGYCILEHPIADRV